MKTIVLFLINLLIASILLFPVTLFSQEKDKYVVSSIKIDIDQLEGIFKQIKLTNLKSNEFPIINQIAAENFTEIFFREIYPKELDDPIRIYWDKYYSKDNNKHPSALIMHPIDYKALLGNTDKKEKSANAYMFLCKKSKTLNLLLNSLLEEKAAQILSAVDNPCGVLKPDITPDNIAKKLSEINQSINLLQSELTKIDADLKSAEEDVIKYSPKITENTEKTLTYMLSKEDDKWNDYLLNKSQMLFVIIGGKNDLSNATLKIDNMPSSFQTSFNEFKELTTQLGVLGEAKDGTLCCSAPVITDSITIKFILINKNEIKAPSIITLSEEKSKLNLKFENHEKAMFGLKVGVSASRFDRKIFSIDSQNNLTIKPDSLQQNEWKSNLMVMLDWYPAGRDIDRLEPIWKNNKDIAFFDLNRLAVTAGLKLSKDPLESCFLGLSYALTKEFSLTGGIAFIATPKDVQNLPVGVNASLDYLKSNAERKLEPSWFFGITLSPGIMSKALGNKK
jgi:hypothetical protein